jgi:hypothetical protein
MVRTSKGNTMAIRPFYYLRVDDLIIGGKWTSAKGERTYGGNLFPESAILIKSVMDGGQIEIQESRDIESGLKLLTFGANRYVAIHNGFLIYFEADLKRPIEHGGLD